MISQGLNLFDPSKREVGESRMAASSPWYIICFARIGRKGNNMIRDGYTYCDGGRRRGKGASNL